MMWLDDRSFTKSPWARQTISMDYYSSIKNLKARIPKRVWNRIGITDTSCQTASAIANAWNDLVDTVEPYGRQITRENIRACTYFWLHLKWINTPGREDPMTGVDVARCAPGTRAGWFLSIRKAIHIFFRVPGDFVGRKVCFKYFPNHVNSLLKINRSRPLYARNEQRFWVGEGGLMQLFDALFPIDKPFNTFNHWTQLSERQQVWCADYIGWLGGSRMVELLYSDSHLARKQGLFWRQFSLEIFRDPSGYLCANKPGIVYFNDYQKNDFCTSVTRVNNRVVLPLKFDVQDIWKLHPTRRHFTIAGLFSLLLGVRLTRSASTLPIADPDAPVFPDMKAPLTNGKWRRNISARRARIVRRQMYRLIYEAALADRMGGHQYRGSRALELAAMGCPAHIIAQMLRFRSLSAMMRYLSSDVFALIGFAHLMPSVGHDKSEYSGLAWFYQNHRLFGDTGLLIADKLKSINYRTL